MPLPDIHIPSDVLFRTLVFSAEETRDWMNILTDEEISRRAGMKNEQRRHGFTAGRVALRTLLGERLGQAPAHVNLIVGPTGRLACPDSGLYLSLAHSGEVAVAAARHRNVGIDLEHVRDKPASLLDYILADEEKEQMTLMPIHPTEALFMCWTLKEAVLKANGTGLRKSPRKVRLSIDLPSAKAGAIDPMEKVWDAFFGINDEYAIALAIDPIG